MDTSTIAALESGDQPVEINKENDMVTELISNDKPNDTKGQGDALESLEHGINHESGLNLTEPEVEEPVVTKEPESLKNIDTAKNDSIVQLESNGQTVSDPPTVITPEIVEECLSPSKVTIVDSDKVTKLEEEPEPETPRKEDAIEKVSTVSQTASPVSCQDESSSNSSPPALVLENMSNEVETKREQRRRTKSFTANEAKQKREKRVTISESMPKTDKRNDDSVQENSSPDHSTNTKETIKCQKVAVLLGFIGKNWQGMSNQPWIRKTASVSRDLERVLIKSGVFPIGKKVDLGFAARTARDVSAQGYIVSTWFSEDVTDFTEAVESINQLVPDHMCILAVRKVANSFHAKHSCNFSKNPKDVHSYVYVLPSFALAPKDVELLNEDYRITEERVDQVNKFLSMYEGDHLYHNFTGTATADAFYSSRRFVSKCRIEKTFERDGMEFLSIAIEGQNFMVLQISTIMGLTIAYMRGQADDQIVASAWKAPLIRLPKAPGLGQVLKSIRYEGYNQKAANKEGVYPPPLEWDEVQSYADYYFENGILKTICQTEKEEKTTLKFIESLENHSYDPKPIKVSSKGSFNGEQQLSDGKGSDGTGAIRKRRRNRKSSNSVSTGSEAM